MLIYMRLKLIKEYHSLNRKRKLLGGKISTDKDILNIQKKQLGTIKGEKKEP